MHNALFASACCVVILGPSLRIITKPTKSLLSENKKKILQNPVILSETKKEQVAYFQFLIEWGVSLY